MVLVDVGIIPPAAELISVVQSNGQFDVFIASKGMSVRGLA